MPYLDPVQSQLSFKGDEGIKYPLFPFVDKDLLFNVSYSDDEEEYENDLDIEITPQEDLDLDPTFIPPQQPKWAQNIIKAIGDVAGKPDDRRGTRS